MRWCLDDDDHSSTALGFSCQDHYEFYRLKWLGEPEWQDNLYKLLGGHYSGYGGKTDLAQDLGVARQTVYQWANGSRKPDVHNRRELQVLADKYADYASQ